MRGCVLNKLRTLKFICYVFDGCKNAKISFHLYSKVPRLFIIFFITVKMQNFQTSFTGLSTWTESLGLGPRPLTRDEALVSGWKQINNRCNASDRSARFNLAKVTKNWIMKAYVAT